MLIFALAFCAGTWLLQQQASLPGVLWSVALLPAVAWLLWWSRSRAAPAARHALTAGCGLAAGFLWAGLLAQVRLADALPTEWEGRDLSITGVVAQLPQPGERGLRFAFDVERVHTPLATVPAHLALNWYRDQAGRLPALRAGQRWQVTVRLRRPHGTSNPHGFDSELWLLERGVRATGYVREAPAAALQDELVARPAYLLQRLREGLRERILDALPGHPAAGVLVALTIGDQDAIDPAQWTVFTRTGVNHLMSISGLHITMLAGLAFGAAFRLWRRSPGLASRLPAQRAAALGGLLVALGYAALAGFGVPAQRTVYMLAAMALALLLGVRAGALEVLAAALLLVLVLDPWAVLSAGFWLSFGAVALILYVSLGRIGRWRWLAGWGRVQWAITLGLVPILVALFQQVSLVSPLANAFAIPVVSLGVVPLALLGAVLPFDFVLAAAAWLMSACTAALAALSALPEAVWQQHAPPAWAAAVACAGVLWLLAPQGMPARWLGLLAMLPLFARAPAGPQPGELWLDVLDVGQGHAAVVRTAAHSLLFDTGPRYSGESDSGSRVIVPFLRGSGVAALDAVVVSHDDTDHSGGLLSVLQALPVEWVATSLPLDEPGLALARSVRRCARGGSWEWDGVRFSFLHPAPGSSGAPGQRDNNRSCVLHVLAPGGSLLLTADIERAAERDLLTQLAADDRADVLLVPHHGSGTSSSEAFVARLRPREAIVPVGYRNRFGHPLPEVVARYQRAGARLWRTDRDGALQVRFGPALAVSAWRAVRPRYWHAR